MSTTSAPTTEPEAAGRSTWRRSGVVRFAVHYVEMVAVMLAGMLVLVLALAALGVRDQLTDDAPALDLFAMGFSMTAPMVAWMSWRGHSAAATREMAAAMIVPTLGVIGLLAAGIEDDVHTLMGIQHVVMFPAMLVVMLFRRDEYTHQRS